MNKFRHWIASKLYELADHVNPDYPYEGKEIITDIKIISPEAQAIVESIVKGYEHK